MSKRSKITRSAGLAGHTGGARGFTGALAGALVWSTVLWPGTLWADDITSRRNPHPDGPSQGLAWKTLRIGYQDPSRDPAATAHACGDSCFSLSPGAVRHLPRLRAAYATRDFSLGLGQSGPVSLRFNGSRLKMHISF